MTSSSTSWRCGRLFSSVLTLFSGSVQLDVESPLLGDFMGALDGRQLLVVEGSYCTIESHRLLT